MQALLYKARKEAGLSQKEMAEKIGVSEATYRAKELGKVDFKSTEMFEIAGFFNKGIEEIFLPTKTTKWGLSSHQN